MKDTTIGNRDAGRRGFALPAVLLALVILTVFGAAAVQISRDELLSGSAMDQSGLAFYAAESGIQATVAGWDQDSIDVLLPNPGDSLTQSWAQLPNGCDYEVSIRRVDGGNLTRALYEITSVGRGPGTQPGQRSVSVVVIEPNVVQIAQALTFGGSVEISGNPIIRGTCADAHANGGIDISGEASSGGGVSATGRVRVGGKLLDENGRRITPESYADPQDVPDYNPMDYCLGMNEPNSWHFKNGKYWDSSRNRWRNVSGIGWKYDSGTYIVDDENIPEGVYCTDHDLEVSKDLGSPGNPFDVTFLTTKSFTVPGNPVMRPYHPDGWMIMADGDMKINGNPNGGTDAFQGTLFAGSKCEISGEASITGRIICRDDPAPSGSENWVSEMKINGNLSITYDCGAQGGTGDSKPLAISGRAWAQVFN